MCVLITVLITVLAESGTYKSGVGHGLHKSVVPLHAPFGSAAWGATRPMEDDGSLTDAQRYVLL